MDLHYSQTIRFASLSPDSFTTLWIYTILKHYIQPGENRQRFHYLMDLHYSQTMMGMVSLCTSFTTLWIYTILKHRAKEKPGRLGFTTLWIYTILKPTNSLLHYRLLFHYLMDLHYSQTDDSLSFEELLFHYLMDLHYSQTLSLKPYRPHCFTTLWIYTILKRFLRAAYCFLVSLPYGFTLFSNLK